MTQSSPPDPDPAAASAIAAHRFGLGEPDLSVVGTDARAWLRAQIGPADPQRGTGLPNLAEALACQLAARQADAVAAKDALRVQVQADMRARLVTAATSTRPFAERLALFWCNHFTVSLGKGSTRGLVGAYEREAIRPHIAGRLVDLLTAAVTHPAMLRYLDNQLSAGPQSPRVQRLGRRSAMAAAAAGAAGADDGAASSAPRLTGLNENLAREVLELHTLGVAGGGGVYGPWGGYSQADVMALAAVLTGWRGPRPGASGALDRGIEADFDPAWHQPGPKTVLDRRYAAGPLALRAVLADLASHPATHRHIASKLARHVVADQPSAALVARLAQRLTDTDGDLTALYQTLIDAPEAWASAPAKLKTPEEFVLSSSRLLGLGEQLARRAPDAGLAALGQRPHTAPSPAGWSDLGSDWLGPEAVWQRVEWATQAASRQGTQVDARALAQASLGALLSPATRQQLERAADGPQALTLLLMAPEFQRR
jgi:uncharacterized protein (DUF1800 family)